MNINIIISGMKTRTSQISEIEDGLLIVIFKVIIVKFINSSDEMCLVEQNMENNGGFNNIF